VQRREDPALLTGEARYLDDLRVDGLLFAAFVRSPYAHALIRGIEGDAFTAADLDLPASPAMGNEVLARPMLAKDRVRFVGEAVAVVTGDSKALAVDAAEQVVVDYEPLPAVVDVLKAIEPDAARSRRRPARLRRRQVLLSRR